MSRCFVDVFNDIQLDESLDIYFSNATVERVVINSQDKELQIHMIFFKTIVHIKFIQQVERILEANICGDSDLSVNIICRYDVNHDLNKILLLYQDSILYELKQHSPVAFGILRKAELNIVEGNITFTLKDSIDNYLYARKVNKRIEDMMKSRFNMETKVSFKVHEAAEETNKKNSCKKNEMKKKRRRL